MPGPHATASAIGAQHFLRRIRASRVARKPFPHLVLEPVFPDDFYALVRRRLPPQSKYIPAVSQYADKTKRESNRFDFWLTEENLVRLDPTRAAFWRDFQRAFTGDAVVDALATKMRGRAGTEPPGRERLVLACRLVRERGAFTLRPHVDRAQHPITTVLYLPENNRRTSMGTTLYRMTDPSHIELDRTVPYRKNAGLVLLRTPDAWHGGDFGHARPDFVRNTIHLYLCAT